MKTRQLTASFMIAFAAVLHADEDAPIRFKRIEYTIDSSNSVIVEVENFAEGIVSRAPVLREVTFVWNGEAIAVPAKILKEMIFPEVWSIKIDAGTYYGDAEGSASSRTLSITFLDPRPDANSVLDPDRKLRAHFLFCDTGLRNVNVTFLSHSLNEDPFLDYPSIWHPDLGYSWRGSKYASLSALLNAKEADLRREHRKPIEPPTPHSKDTKSNQETGANKI